jgi:hypothetical protein
MVQGSGARNLGIATLSRRLYEVLSTDTLGTMDTNEQWLQLADILSALVLVATRLVCSGLGIRAHRPSAQCLEV